MDLPRDSSDIQIALACQACNGNGGFGTRCGEGGNKLNPCTTCNGTGWTLKRPGDLTAGEFTRLHTKIRQSVTHAESASSIIGEIIEAGTDDSGQPRITIHTTKEELKRIEIIRFYQQARITFALL